MSRNLGERDCVFCGARVVLLEKPRKITEADAGVYYEAMRGTLVAKAECHACLAPYLAWVGNIPHRTPHPCDADATHVDLSHYHSFNDEPSERDLPVYDVETRIVRTGLYSGKGRSGDYLKAYLRLGEVKPPEEKKP